MIQHDIFSYLFNPVYIWVSIILEKLEVKSVVVILDDRGNKIEESGYCSELPTPL